MTTEPVRCSAWLGDLVTDVEDGSVLLCGAMGLSAAALDRITDVVVKGERLQIWEGALMSLDLTPDLGCALLVALARRRGLTPANQRACPEPPEPCEHQ